MYECFEKIEYKSTLMWNWGLNINTDAPKHVYGPYIDTRRLENKHQVNIYGTLYMARVRTSF